MQDIPILYIIYVKPFGYGSQRKHIVLERCAEDIVRQKWQCRCLNLLSVQNHYAVGFSHQ